jgi:hypothetical protein
MNKLKTFGLVAASAFVLSTTSPAVGQTHNTDILRRDSTELVDKKKETKNDTSTSIMLAIIAVATGLAFAEIRRRRSSLPKRRNE